MKLQTTSSAQTQKIAKLMAAELLKEKGPKHARVITLKGNLGAGKTTFIQGFLRGLGVKSKITSPTFVITKKYQIPRTKLQKNSKIQKAYHMDAYRIKSAKEILDLNWREIISDPKSIILIEWPEHITRILPKNRIQIIFKHGKHEHERELTFH